MKLSDGNILCGCQYEVLGVYNIKSNLVNIQNNILHKKDISSLLNIKDNTFIRSSYDGVIKISNMI